MDKNKDNTFDVPAADIQDKITVLMGLPPEEAAARLDKQAPPRRVVSGNPPVAPTSESSLPDEPVKDTQQVKPVIADVQADDAIVDEIIANEKTNQSNDLEKSNEDYLITSRPKKGIKKLFSQWWHNRLLRNLTILILFAVIIFIIAIPSTRYKVLNGLGVRASLSVKVIDTVNGRPIKNVAVSIGETSTKTDQEGVAQLNNVPLGDATLVMQKRSFKEESVPITVGWGSNPFDAPIELVPTGTTFSFKITDWLSGTPLQNVEVSDGESIALSDEAGIAKLTVEPTDADIVVTTNNNGYRAEAATLPADTVEDTAITLVPSKKDVFISKRNGVYDVYGRYVDGRDEQVLLAGTGSEQIDTHVLSHPYNGIAALVSSRAGNRSDDGNMLSDVYIISTDTKQAEKIEGSSSERIRLIGWSGDSLMYVSSNVGVTAAENKQKLFAYNTKEKSTNELVSASYFTDVRVINDAIYYVLPKSDGTQSGGLTKISSSGKDKSVVLAKEVWGVYRSSKDTLQISAAGDEWYEVSLADSKVTKLEGAPPLVQNRVYSTNTSSTQSAWIEERDGKASLIVVDKNTNNQKELFKQAGMTYPIQWLNDSALLYTVSGPQETATYVVSTINGTAKRVGDVTVSVYNDNQYYY